MMMQMVARDRNPAVRVRVPVDLAPRTERNLRVSRHIVSRLASQEGHFVDEQRRDLSVMILARREWSFYLAISDSA